MSDETKLPTVAEIIQLPRWARVAYAARCARRALPLYKIYQPDAPKSELELLEATVQSIEEASVIAQNRNVPTSNDHVIEISIKHINDKAIEVILTITIAQNVFTAYDAFESFDYQNVLATAQVAQHCLKAGVHANAIARDFQTILNQSQREKWGDSSPVLPTVFDPLNPVHYLTLDLYIKPGTDPIVIGDAVVKLWEAANEYHMARGGGVLTLDDFQQLFPALLPVGTGPYSYGG